MKVLVNMSFSDNSIIDNSGRNWSSYNLDLSNNSPIKEHRSCKFDGISERCIETQDLIKIDKNEDFIIAFWYKDNSNFTKLAMNVLSEKCTSITDKNAPMNPCIVFENGKLICQDDDDYMLSYELGLKDNEWHHYCIMRSTGDDGKRYVSLYIDGDYKEFDRKADYVTGSLSFMNMIIGDNTNNGSYKLNGCLDDLFIASLDKGDCVPPVIEYECMIERNEIIAFDDYYYWSSNWTSEE